MAKDVEYEDEEEIPQDLSEEDSLDFDDGEEKVKPRQPEKRPAPAVPLPVPASPELKNSNEKEEAKENAAEQMEQTKLSPEMQAQILIENIIASIEDLENRVTKIESDLYRRFIQDKR